MSRRTRWTWIAFWVCALLVIDGLAWITWSVIRLDREQRLSNIAAQHAERVRLALWRMDSNLTPLISQESARPYFEYRAFYPAQRAYSRMWSPVEADEVRVASPLLTYFQDNPESGALVKLHFQIEPDGSVTSPQTPTGEELLIAQDRLLDAFGLFEAESRLALLSAIISAPIRLEDTRPVADRAGTSAKASVDTERSDALSAAVLDEHPVLDDPLDGVPLVTSTLDEGLGETAAQPASADVQDLRARQETLNRSLPQQTATQYQVPQPAKHARDGRHRAGLTMEDGTSPAANADASEAAWARALTTRDQDTQGLQELESHVQVSPFSAVWLRRGTSPELLLIREVTQGERRLRQGVWLDWPALRQQLLDAAGTLLPDAELIPTASVAGRTTTMMQNAARLAALPIIVDTGAPSSVSATPDRTVLLTLSITWIAVLGGTVAIGLVLRESVRLSERRGRFVSAVTHELRTPLTTFMLYTQMLADGLVKDEDAKREYLHTLKRESGRLGEVVESVLAYARLGQPTPARRDPHAPGARVVLRDAIERVLPSLEARAGASGMRIVADVESIGATEIRGEPESLGRILSNLVENACKYGAPSQSATPDETSDRALIELSARITPNGRALIRVRDFGPGVPAREAKRIFQAFYRGPDERAAGGLGIGLTLSQGLARELGGDLWLVTPSDAPGACFELELPVAASV